MIDLAILITVLRRPQNVQPLLDSIINTTSSVFDVLFLVTPGDKEEISELKRCNQSYIIMDDNYETRGDYARKINTGFSSVKASWYFLGADDLRFHPLWFENAMDVHRRTDDCVIGTNDMGNPSVVRGLHATHSLVLRDYVLDCGTIDEPGKVLHEGYQHNFVDSEFVETAKWRGAWSFSMHSKVEHLHPDWKKGNQDGVYQIGKSGWTVDQTYFERRKKLWP